MESDRELLERAAGGDRIAYRDLVRRYQGVVYGFSLHLTRDPGEAHRLARETCVEGFFATGACEDPYAWIARLQGIATDRFREGRRVKSSSIVTAEERPAGAAGQGSAPSLETLLAIADEVHALPEPERIAITLKHTNGMASEEIASATGETSGAVSTHLSRGFKTLRDGLIRRIREGGISVGV